MTATRHDCPASISPPTGSFGAGSALAYSVLDPIFNGVL